MELIGIVNREVIEAELYNYSDTKRLLEKNIDNLTNLEVLECSRRLKAIEMVLDELKHDKTNMSEIKNKVVII